MPPTGDTHPSSEANVPPDTFTGEITVASTIIDQLSSGLYETPAACIKELLNNAYDADATRVRMSIRPDADTIIIDDNGDGISKAAFEEHFKRIARSHKRDDGETTGSGRPKIGKIGIGFIAANEICDQMEIVSTTRGSHDLLEVAIDFASMRDALYVERRREGEDVAKGDYKGQVSSTVDLDDHYTQVYLRNVRGESREILSGAYPGRGRANLYGLKPETIRDRLASGLPSWKELDSYSRAILELGLYVPVRYHDRWMPDEYAEELQEFSDRAAQLNFDVVIDGTDLRKPTVLTTGSDGKSLLRIVNLQGSHVSAQGYLYASSGKLFPAELNGVLIRIRNAAANAAAAGYDRTFLEYPTWLDKIFQGWVSCELYADDRLESALNIDRRTLRPTHEAFIELQDMFHAELKSFFAEIRSEIYSRRSTERRKAKAQEQSRQLDELTDELSRRIGSRSARNVTDELRGRGSSRTRSREPSQAEREREPEDLNFSMLTTRYTPAEVLQIVTEVTAEIGLDSVSTRALLAAVARRLRG